MDIEFNFTLDSAPENDVPYKYRKEGSEYYLTVKYKKDFYFPEIYIDHITIERDLDLESHKNIPNYRVMGRSARTTASLQMPIEKFCRAPCKRQTLQVGQSAVFKITNLRPDETFKSNLRCDSFTLTSNGITRSYKPTKYNENQVDEASIMAGGRRKTRNCKNKYRSLKNKQSRRNRRR